MLAPERMKAQGKPAKFILIVRNPVDRAISDYTQELVHNYYNLPKFEDFITDQSGGLTHADEYGVLAKGIYDVQYQRWLKLFNKSQILVLDGNELVSDPVSVLQQTEKFLNLRNYFTKELFYFSEAKGFYCWKKPKNAANPSCLGSGQGRPHPIVNSTVIDQLKQYYRPHMAEFCHLASVNFTWCTL